jgi:predicted metal-dependent hydrolase
MMDADSSTVIICWHTTLINPFAISFNMNLGEKAYRELYPDREEPRTISVKYSRAFSNYNANIRYSAKVIQFRLSYMWREVSEDIVLGLLQSLLVKMFKERTSTMYIELYDKFIKNLSTYAIKDTNDPTLEESFHRVNERYFGGFMEKPNLVWADANYRRLGSYEFATDTIRISSIFQEEKELMDYIMYHELLHKKLKFHSKEGRSFYHTRQFREMEHKFDNSRIEKDLEDFLRRKRMKDWFKWW